MKDMTAYWAIVDPVDVRSRIKIDSGRPLFAHFDAKLLPSDEQHAGIRIEYSFARSEDAKWCKAVATGVETFIQRRIEEQKPVRDTTLVMTRVIAHQIDTDEYAVAYNVARCLQLKFDELSVQVANLE